MSEPFCGKVVIGPSGYQEGRCVRHWQHSDDCWEGPRSVTGGYGQHGERRSLKRRGRLVEATGYPRSITYAFIEAPAPSELELPDGVYVFKSDAEDGDLIYEKR